MQPILYLDPMAKFPESKEKPGYYVVFDECSGDALTFKVATKDMKQVLTKSVVCPVDDIKHRNRPVTFKKDIDAKLEKQDIVRENLLHHEEQVPSDQDINSNNIEDLPEPTEQTIIEAAEKDNNEEGIASRTRSTTRMAGTLNTKHLQDICDKTITEKSCH